MKNKSMIMLLMISLLLVELSQCDLNEDRAKCGDQLVAVATCLPYVSNEALMPTQDCCGGFKQVLDKSPACFCLLIKDRNDPSLGLQINATRALTLPQRCEVNTTAQINDCPAALNLPPNSPEAQIFTQFGDTKGNPTTTKTPSDPTNNGKIINSNSTTTSSPVSVSSGSSTSADARSSRAMKVETTSFGVLAAMVAARILAYTT